MSCILDTYVDTWSQDGWQPAVTEPLYKHTNKYVGPCTRAAEGPDLDQVLSRLRDNSRRGPPLGARCPGPASPCSPLPTLQGAASAVLASCRDSCCKIVIFCENCCCEKLFILVLVGYNWTQERKASPDFSLPSPMSRLPYCGRVELYSV